MWPWRLAFLNPLRWRFLGAPSWANISYLDIPLKRIVALKTPTICFQTFGWVLWFRDMCATPPIPALCKCFQATTGYFALESLECMSSPSCPRALVISATPVMFPTFVATQVDEPIASERLMLSAAWCFWRSWRHITAMVVGRFQKRLNSFDSRDVPGSYFLICFTLFYRHCFFDVFGHFFQGPSALDLEESSDSLSSNEPDEHWISELESDSQPENEQPLPAIP